MSLQTKTTYLEHLVAAPTLSTPDPCPICHDDIKAPFKTECNHIFCVECLKTWLESANTCPSCRNKLFEKVESDTTGAAVDAAAESSWQRVSAMMGDTDAEFIRYPARSGMPIGTPGRSYEAEARFGWLIWELEEELRARQQEEEHEADEEESSEEDDLEEEEEDPL
ncbi:hypothetical protein CLAFUW4_09796 [Fulvia fulva]|uniref:RING-type domain-containing protein n=1 Tax=Passalora fulva TaxID=5499 RepID=A0A9Q8UUP2_PASFU|nr:uncharacterized protein CLAFUR5_12442 [Fulvia fulva]KAK4616226.1 hypothetical protein CLAFUR4_09802 [Fulvia fulva]KAK4616404.1 hypothetical protein CLAFUR0_09795 [Fulvia fulva]UJO23080.1 hypothetical protein CLAFUR5_12442 [Fulvia fulva]WPV19073.1 hypothetical protein CLAFUW4_09796 [Fulvia fulva]WPV34402.1 hypothetical protein CLAFUW7_09799 [Fulvia fulva]